MHSQGARKGDGRRQEIKRAKESTAQQGELRHPARPRECPIVSNKTHRAAANPRDTPGAPGITREDPLTLRRTCRRHSNSYSCRTQPHLRFAATLCPHVTAPSRQPVRDTHAYTINTEAACAATAKTRTNCTHQQSVDKLEA